ncbi:hypothetical protein ACQ4PT_012187 [Festuca glaucescens]
MFLWRTLLAPSWRPILMIVGCFLLSMVLLVDVSSVICGTEVTHLIYMVALLGLAHTRALIIPSSCRFSAHQRCLHCQTTTGLMDGAAASSSTTTQGDKGVHWAVQNGLDLSRSTVVYFKHNDMASLASTLEKLTSGNKHTEKIRCYIVVESIYQNSGQIAPLDEIIKLKVKYRFRVILEESHSFGVLGKCGRGLAEHYGVPINKVDIITAGMGNALATDGGFCTGSARVVDHQRLSSSGYVFSNSLAPYLATATVSAVNYLEGNSSVLSILRTNVALLHKD